MTDSTVLKKYNNPSARHRQVRVFISSAFRDMQDERNTLMTQVYPKIRRICREHGVEFVEVDLCLGITEDQAQRKETLRSYLNEIIHASYFFIKLLHIQFNRQGENLINQMLY